jgi:chromate transporter
MPKPQEPALSPVSSSPAAELRRPLPGPAELFLGFAQIAACGFGGVMAWSRRIIVEDRRWLTPEEFNQQLALCQILPGGNILNFSVMFGYRAGGTLGSLAALAGLIGPPTLLMILAGMLYRRFGDLPALRGMFVGLAAGAAGLLIATVAKMVGTTVKGRLRPAHLITAATFVTAGLLRWPLPWVIVAVMPVSVALAWWERR